LSCSPPRTINSLVKPIREHLGHKLARHAGDDAFRRAFLAEVAEAAGRDFAAAPDTCFAAVRQAQLDVLGDLVAAHLDRAALSQLIREGPPAGLPVIHPAGAVV
jgi:hypothetical protein